MSKSYKVQQSISGESGSAYSRYLDLVIGQRSLVQLIKFELIHFLCSKMSGALGLLLRKKLYPSMLGSVGRGVVFGANVTLRHPHKIHLGDSVIIDDNVMLDAKGASNQGIRMGNEVFIGRNTILSCKDGDINLDDRCNIGFNCDIFSSNSVSIGKDTIIAAYTYILGGGNYQIDHIDRPIAESYDFEGKGGVVIQDNVWLGAHVTVVDGVTIENGCVISAGAVVTKDLGSNSIAMGIPAKVVRQRKV